MKQTEAEFQKSVCEMARRCGWRVAHFHDSRRQVREGVYVGDKDAAGFPDLVLVRRGSIIFAELKSESGHVRAQQQEWLDDLSYVGGPVRVFLWRPADWVEIERTL